MNNKPKYKHCLNCKYCVGIRHYGNTHETEHYCSIKHVKCDWSGRLKALLCRFFEQK